MVLGIELAVAMRAKGGSNFLLQSWGIGAKLANDSMHSAAAVLAEYASNGGQGDVDKTGDTAPNFAYGDILVQDSRYRVVYRLVNTVYIMAIASAAANVFALMKLVDALTAIATTASRGVEVTPEKLSRRYPELYTAVRLAVSSNGSADVSSILTESDTSLAAKLNVISNQPVPDPVKVGKSFTARLTGLGRKTGTATPDASVISRPSISQRTVEEAEDPMSRMEFQLPPEALVPLPGSTLPPKRRPAAAAAAATASEDPFDAFGSMPGSAAQQAAVRDDFGSDLDSLGALGAPQAQAAAASDPFKGVFGSMDMSTAMVAQPGGTSGPAPLDLDMLLGPNSGPPGAPQGFPKQPSAQGDWASFTTPRPGAATAAGPAWDAFTQAETPSKGVQFTPPAPKALRQATPADLEAVANGEGLQLLETWQGSFTGSKLLKAGVLGQVGSSGSMSHVECSVGFKLQPPAAGARILSAGLRCAMLNKGAAQRGRGTARSAFTADLGKLARSEDKEPLLKYRLPAVACPPPLVLQVTPLLSSQSGSSQRGVLFVVQYQVNPQLRGVLRSATFTLQCPRILGEPKKVATKASWSKQRQLRWEFPQLEAASKGSLRALFVPEGSNEAASATAAYDVTCIAHFYGSHGQTLSGIVLESGSSATATKISKCMWHGTATAKSVR